jgi:hypothetical protein
MKKIPAALWIKMFFAWRSSEALEAAQTFGGKK